MGARKARKFEVPQAQGKIVRFFSEWREPIGYAKGYQLKKHKHIPQTTLLSVACAFPGHLFFSPQVFKGKSAGVTAILGLPRFPGADGSGLDGTCSARVEGRVGDVRNVVPF